MKTAEVLSMCESPVWLSISPLTSQLIDVED